MVHFRFAYWKLVTPLEQQRCQVMQLYQTWFLN